MLLVELQYSKFQVAVLAALKERNRTAGSTATFYNIAFGFSCSFCTHYFVQDPALFKQKKASLTYKIDPFSLKKIK